MTDSSRTYIADIETRIEELQDQLRGATKSIALSRIALWGGLALLALVFGGYILSNRIEIGVAAFSAALGGIVVGGSSRSTARQLADMITGLETERREAIDALDLQFVRASDPGSRQLH